MKMSAQMTVVAMLATLAWLGLAFRSVVGLMLAALTLIPLIARIHSEEALLRAHFGAEYDVYCARSWRWVPGVY